MSMKYKRYLGFLTAIWLLLLEVLYSADYYVCHASKSAECNKRISTYLLQSNTTVSPTKQKALLGCEKAQTSENVENQDTKAYIDQKQDINRTLCEELKQILKWEKTQYGIDTDSSLTSGNFLNRKGSSLRDWYAFAITRSGEEDSYQTYAVVLQEMLKQSIKEGKLRKEFKATDLQRICLTCAALGGDVFADLGNGESMYAYATYSSTKQIEEQGINACIWSIISADCFRTKIKEKDFVNKQIKTLVQTQQKDGSFSLDGTEGDVDVTAMALQALAPHYKEAQSYVTPDGKKNGRQVVASAINWLSKQQLDSGAFKSYETENAESTAQVMIALNSLQIPLEDSRFVKNGHTLLDALLSFRVGDGGYAHTLQEKRGDEMTGQQVYLAYVSYLRQEQNLHSLYDLRNETDFSTYKNTIAKHDSWVCVSNPSYTYKQNAYHFTRQEQLRVHEICKHKSVKTYDETISLLAKLQLSKERKKYQKEEKQLLEEKQALAVEQKKISAINTKILEQIYPMNHLTKEQEKKLYSLQKEIASLEKENQAEIFLVEGIIQYKKHKLPLGLSIVVCLGCLSMLIATSLCLRNKKGKSHD